jgi:hypothetical protein
MNEPVIPIVNHPVENKPPVAKAEAENGIVLKKFYPEDVETILSTFALTGGNASKTSRMLESDFNLTVHPVTIKKMAREQFPVKYAEIQENLGSQINSVVTGRLGEVVLKGTDVQSNLLDRIDKQLDSEQDIPVKDLAPAFRNISQATKDSLMQKQLLENKPTGITEVRTIEEAIKELEDDEIVIDIEPTSEETVPVENNEKTATESMETTSGTNNSADQSTEGKKDQTQTDSDAIHDLEKSNDVFVSDHINETIEDFPF